MANCLGLVETQRLVERESRVKTWQQERERSGQGEPCDMTGTGYVTTVVNVTVGYGPSLPSSTMSTRPLKRTRLSTDYTADSQRHLSSSSSTSSSGLHRHPEIWYDDGNIVLIAGATAFRIYRGLLAGQSTVFSDMFSSSISNPDEMFDGCPVVHLSDSPHDLAHLLHLLLPKSHIQ